MAVQLDANAAGVVNGSGIILIDMTSLTIGSGSNMAIIVQANFTNTNLSSVVWDFGGSAQTLSPVAGTNGATGLIKTSLWGRLAPVAGNKTLRFTFSGSTTTCCLNAFSLTNVLQAPANSLAFTNGTNATGSGAAPTLTVTGGHVGDMAVGHFADTAGNMDSVDNTQLFVDNVLMLVGGSIGLGAASVTFTASVSGAGNFAASGMNVEAARNADVAWLTA